MTDNNSNLPINFFQNAPWLIEGDASNLSPQIFQGSVEELLGKTRYNRLTIITDGGNVYEQYQFMGISNGKIKIEKPSAWKDSTGAFHVFFKNRDSIWNFFLAQDIVYDLSSLLMAQPERIFSLQRRRHKRVLAPVGSKALFRGLDNRIDSAHIQDISEGGMQICVNSTTDKYPADSIINEIFIAIPPKIRKGQENTDRRIIPLIRSGKVVRTFYDQEHSVAYYGISFFCDSAYVKESVSNLVAYLDKPSA